MVVIHFKRGEKEEFLHETSATTLVDEVIAQLCALHNARQRLRRLADGLEGLAEAGALNPEAVRGLTTPETRGPALQLLSADERLFVEATPHAGQELRPDKTGWRCGRAPAPDVAAKLRGVATEARMALAAKDRVCTAAACAELESLARGAIMIAYPAFHGLPPWDPVHALLTRPEATRALFPDADWLDAADSALWWARKELPRGKPLSAAVGANEKTKIVAKIVPRGQGAPVSEPPVDKETHLKMLAFYHRRQEEEKRLAEAVGDEYLASEWANPRGLKQQLVSGGRGIAFKRP